MFMEDFYKQFKENLENREEPVVENKLWEKLEKDLNHQEKSLPKSGFANWGALGLLLLLLLGSNIYSILEMKKANKKMATLEQRTDTIFQTKIVYQIDTVFQTVTKREEVIRYRTATFSKNDLVLPASFSTTTSTPLVVSKNRGLVNNTRNLLDNTITSTALFSAYLQEQQLINYSDNKVTNTAITASPEISTNFSISSPISTIAPSVIDYVPNTLRALDIPALVITPRKKTIAQRIYPMQPKGFSIGAVAGTLLPLGKELSSKFSYSAGLEATIEFSPSLQLWASASFLNLSFETEQFNETVGIPSTLPPSDDFEFQQANTIQPSLQYSLGMQYTFNAQKRWQPLVGIGYAAMQLLPYEVYYEFEIPDQDIKWVVDEELDSDELVNGLLLLKGGINFNVSKHWNWKVQAIYRNQLKGEGLQSPSILGLQSGISYKF